MALFLRFDPRSVRGAQKAGPTRPIEKMSSRVAFDDERDWVAIQGARN